MSQLVLLTNRNKREKIAENETQLDNIAFVDEGAFSECENLSQVNLSPETMFIPQSEEYPSFPESTRINAGKN